DCLEQKAEDANKRWIEKRKQLTTAENNVAKLKHALGNIKITSYQTAINRQQPWGQRNIANHNLNDAIDNQLEQQQQIRRR
ncbi:unnamed protein product, partial [Adineta ricciae]